MNSLEFPLEVKAVLIDLDGTLLDTIHDLVEAANGMLTALDMATLPAERIKTFVGKGMLNLIGQKDLVFSSALLLYRQSS